MSEFRSTVLFLVEGKISKCKGIRKKFDERNKSLRTTTLDITDKTDIETEKQSLEFKFLQGKVISGLMC